MIKLKIKELILQRAGKATPYTLLKFGISNHTARAYLNGTAKSIKFAHLEKICLYFNCTPKEALGVYDQPEGIIPPFHPLNEWVRTRTAFPMQLFRDFSPDQLERAETYLMELMRENQEKA